MKSEQVNPEVIAAITTAKAMVVEITGRQATDISVALDAGFDGLNSWAVCVFESNFQSITARGEDLEAVIEDIRKKHADHLTGIGSSVDQVKRLAEKLGVRVEVLP